MKKPLSLLCLLASAFAVACSSVGQPSVEKSGSSKQIYENKNYDVAAIVWPAYQNEARWKELGIFDHGNGEWQNVYEAKPKFKGHAQPMVPLWGYERDDDPIAMARQIDAALAAKINVFVYDWYWYQGRPFLEGALNNGFLKAPNNERMKFFLMWANHHVDNLWNNKIADKKVNPPLYDARVSYDEFTIKLVPRFVEYFKKSNHYKINNKPVFSIYRFGLFMEGIGDSKKPPLLNIGAELKTGLRGDYAKKTKSALKYLDDACKKAGFDGVYILVFGGLPEKIIVDGKAIKGRDTVAQYFGIEGTTTYNWNYGTWSDIQNTKPFLTYDKWFAKSRTFWDKLGKNSKTDFYPNVTIGWDTNPRYPQYAPMVKDSNPKNFEMALRVAKDWTDKNIKPSKPKLILINSWNEWTEGSVLMPDTQFGYGYLNACANVFSD